MLSLAAVSRERGKNGDAVEIVGLQTLVAIALLIASDAGKVAEGWHEVVEGEGQVADGTGLHMSRPSGNEWNADTSLVSAALQPTETTVAIEEGGVGTAFLVGSVVAGENEQGVIGESFLVEQLHDLTHIGIEARDHRSKLGMGMQGGVVARCTLPTESLVVGELCAVAY